MGSPLSPVRRRIAERMLQSSRSTAPVTLTTTADATNLVNLRQQFRAVAAAGEPVPGYTDFLVKLAAVALQKHPALNAWASEGQIVTSTSIHIGIAVDTEAGLFVPVVREVPALTLKGLAARARELAERARQGKLTAEEMQGGTFTVTNLGAFGIDAFTPLLNPPQCAVLGIGRIAPRPVVKDGQVVAREQVTLSLTFDHRLTDGAPASRFLQTLVALIENPGPCLIP
jgi:pyruvate dehydrogenase E2 component (dihydrolipoamide acetyltransferase)